MARSVSFDRAAGYYDATRALTDEADQAQARLLTDELSGRGLSLEIGVGTGRVALPLHRAGIPMVGIDLSTEMLGVLIEKAGRRPFPLALADATRLPFPEDTFAAALAAHVLHLVSDRQAVLRELARVIRPGGVILLELGGPAGRAGMAWWAEAREVFARAAGIEAPPRTGHIRDEVDRVLVALGGRPRELPGIEERRTWIPEERIARLEQGMYSFTWDADEASRLRGGAALRTWATERLGSLDRPVEALRTITWIAYDL